MWKPRRKLSRAHSHLLALGSCKCEQLPENAWEQKQRVRPWCGIQAVGQPCNQAAATWKRTQQEAMISKIQVHEWFCVWLILFLSQNWSCRVNKVKLLFRSDWRVGLPVCSITGTCSLEIPYVFTRNNFCWLREINLYVEENIRLGKYFKIWKYKCSLNNQRKNFMSVFKILYRGYETRSFQVMAMLTEQAGSEVLGSFSQKHGAPNCVFRSALCLYIW